MTVQLPQSIGSRQQLRVLLHGRQVPRQGCRQVGALEQVPLRIVGVLDLCGRWTVEDESGGGGRGGVNHTPLLVLFLFVGG